MEAWHQAVLVAPAGPGEELPVGRGHDPAPATPVSAQPVPREPVVDTAAAQAAHLRDFLRRVNLYVGGVGQTGILVLQ